MQINTLRVRKRNCIVEIVRALVANNTYPPDLLAFAWERTSTLPIPV
jgi:hypothetical protein